MWLLPAIILELKSNEMPEAAISQIKRKEYYEKLKKEYIENVLLVEISYDPGQKAHHCVIEGL